MLETNVLPLPSRIFSRFYLKYTKDCANGGGAKEHNVHVGDVVRLSYDPGRQTLENVLSLKFCRLDMV